MSDKYIIKNCPSCTKQDECIAMFLRTSVDCKYRNDCVLKQIVEKCKGIQQEEYTVKERDKLTGEVISIIAYKLNPNYDFAQEILNLLQIEEIESEDKQN